MNNRALKGRVPGRKGVAVRAAPDSIGWLGQNRATQNAPFSGGGPEQFKPQGPEISDAANLLQELIEPRPLNAPEACDSLTWHSCIRNPCLRFVQQRLLGKGVWSFDPSTSSG